MEAQDSIEKLKAEENITKLTLKNSVISESNIRLQKEKEELSAVVDSIKNKLTEISLNLPTHTAEKGSSGGTGEDGLIAQLTNLLNQNRDLKQNLEKDKLVNKTEIAILKKKIDELNIEKQWRKTISSLGRLQRSKKN